ncbi:MAG TPA: PH domain-containing protein [Pirellulales bacterium]|nr:PH domain-containing protein [Pirellulales bacterium]
MSYRAKRDWWAKFLLAPLLVALIGGGIWILYTGVVFVQVPTMLVLQWQRPAHEMAIGLIMIVIGAALFWSLVASRYQIGEPELIIGSGIDQRRVALSSIVEVVPTSAAFRGGWSRAPAWSFDLLRVTYQPRVGRPTSVVIAPADKDEFLHALAEAAPQLRWSDDRALRLATQVTNN